MLSTGFRSENRYTVVQCLSQTLDWPPPRWRVLDAAHRKRNLAEYEGHFEVEESTVSEMCSMVAALIADATALSRIEWSRHEYFHAEAKDLIQCRPGCQAESVDDHRCTRERA